MKKETRKKDRRKNDILDLYVHMLANVPEIR